MKYLDLGKNAQEFLHHFCTVIPTRRLGSEGNRQAAAIFDSWMAERGFQVEKQEFDCQDWEGTGASLCIEGAGFAIIPSPHSLGCQVTAPLAAATTVEELETMDAAGKLLLLRGEIAASQLMPTNYPFYFPDEHRRIFELLELKKPAVILTATGRNPELVGGIYPFPMIEDGNFNIPSVYLTEEEGLRMADLVGKSASLESSCQRIPSHGWNSVAHLHPDIQPRVVLTAHMDAKPGTPGALDNAAGIITLMLLGAILQDHPIRLGIDIVSLNGEDHYQARGEVVYLEKNAARMEQISLEINLDGLGGRGMDTAFSFYGCPDDLMALGREVLSAQPGMVEGEQFYQGDHMMFFQQGRPAMAFTSRDLGSLMAAIIHTPQDSPDKVDPDRLVMAARALHVFLCALAK